MKSKLKMQVTPPVLELTLTGKVTRPSVAATDPSFDVSKYQRTDLAQTFAKARKQLRG